MILSPNPERGVSLIMLEGCLAAITVAVAFAFPRLGNGFFCRVEGAFRRLARRKALSVFVVGAAAFLLRLAIVPLCPIPRPFLPDDFSFMLAADTFASGRLTNPTPVMWMHLESVHITMQPTYMSMYFPGPGLVMAAGKFLTGNPWFGILAMSALMCGAIVWMLQAWLPPTWALLGGVIAILRIGLFSYWTNTFSGGGSIAALGGALLLGGLPRFIKTAKLGDALLMGIGIALVALTRPYEGILLCLPVIVLLARWLLRGKNRPAPAVLLRRTALPLVVIVAACAWMGYYNYRAFGNPLTPAYSVNRKTYAMAPYFVWQSARPQPAYRHAVMKKFYYQDEMRDFKKIHNPIGFIPQNILKAARGMLFYAGILLLLPLIMLRRVLLDRRIRFLVVCCLVLAAGMMVEIFLIPHYLAPFTAAFYAIGLQAMRHLRVWKPGNQPVGMVLVRLTVTLCVVLAGVRLYAEPLHFALPVWPAVWASEWYGPGPSGMRRAAVEAQLEQQPGKQLVLVRYSPTHSPLIEWVYNAADIDHSKVIWAWDMGPAKNRELIQYYKGRHVWLVQPDLQPAGVSPYPITLLRNTAVAANRNTSIRIAPRQSQEVSR